MHLYDPYLALISDNLDDLEATRIAIENRVRMLTRTETDSDGEQRGLGLDERLPEVARARALLDNAKALENDTKLELCRRIRKSPFAAWIKREKGIGEKQAARLISVIGDPYWNDLHDRPRAVSELWAYAGYSVIGGNAQRRTKGERSNWNPKAKMRAYLMAESCVKSGGRYRGIYDDAKEASVGAIHAAECKRCGPSGNPAQPGSPLSDGHRHARARRKVAKEILKDLWREARTAHTGELDDENLAA